MENNTKTLNCVPEGNKTSYNINHWYTSITDQQLADPEKGRKSKCDQKQFYLKSMKVILRTVSK